jgi:hypothetical protein
MIRIWHIGVFVAALLVAGVALTPAQLLFRGSEGVLTFKRAEGTIWRSTLRQVDLGGLNGGDAIVSISFLDLLQGQIVSQVDFAGADISGQARMYAGFNGDRRIEAQSLSISGMRVQGFGRVSGKTTLTGVDIRFAGRDCASARGQIESDVLARTAEQAGSQAPLLAGTASCAGQFGRLMLQGDGAGDSATALLDLGSDGTGQWNVTYRTAKPELAATLVAAGFAPNGEGGTFDTKGTMTWLPY